MFNRRVAQPREKGFLIGHKSIEKVARAVAIRGDQYRAGSLFEMFRLRRVLLNEVGGCGDLAVFLESALISQGLWV